MLDIKYVLENMDQVILKLQQRTGDYSYLRDLISLDSKRKECIIKADEIKNRRNVQSKEIGKLKAQKKEKEASELLSKLSFDKEEIERLDQQRVKCEEKIREILLKTPNLPDDSLPVGEDESKNRVEKYYLKPTEFTFKPLSHWELGAKMGYFDYDRAGKVTGSRFTFYLGAFAKLERALSAFMLDVHSDNGYVEVLPPFLVNSDSLTGSGQLPKFADQAYLTENTSDSLWLIPTAEVPITNYYRNEILDYSDLPKSFVGYSSCFRAEAGAAGRDTRGIIRQHQFQKVELVKFTSPETSFEELEKLTSEAELILKLLKLPFRRVCLSTGDLGFSAAKTYDLEVFLPSYNVFVLEDGKYVCKDPVYKEISSCSNDTDYQARRMNIRFKRNSIFRT